jgi:hypothetical protein
MNPAQFQNMGAMGAGVPNPMQQQMRATPNPSSQQIQRHILNRLAAHTQSLQQHGKFTKWHSTVPIEQRAAQVKLLIDSLRLIQPVVAYEQAINVALTFEQKAFSQETTQEKYFTTIKDKLSRIQDTRASQVQSQSNNLQQMMQPGQNMAFNPQFQQMQPSPMMAQSMPQGQQNLSHGMPGQPGLLQQNMQQRMNIQNKQVFSEEENKHINQLAANMAKRASPEDMAKIREALTEQQKQHMAQRNIDPLAAYFRNHAAKEYSRQRLAAQVQNSVPQAQQQMALNFGVQPPNPSFPASINQLQGQQAEGLRSQEVGELVVPASNTQGMNPDQFQLREQMLQNHQRQANGTPNPMLGQQQNQQNRQAQVQAQSRAQAAARAAQLGLPGQNQQNMSQSNTPLSQLNRAQGLNRPPSRAPHQPQQGVPGQPVPQQQPGPGTQNPLAKFTPELQAILRQKPRSEWAATAKAYMQPGHVGMERSLSQQPNSMPMQNNGQIQQLPNGQYLGGSTIAPSMQPSLSSGAIPTQAQPPRSQPENAQQMLQQQQQQRQLQQNQELTRQRQLQMSQIHAQQVANQQQQAQLQQHLQGGQFQQQPAKPPAPPLTPQQMAYMDQQETHVTIAQNLSSHAQWSPQIKTWGQLKQWLQRVQIPTLPLSRVEEVQRNQFANLQARSRMIAQQQQRQQQQAGGLPIGQAGLQGQQLQQQMINQGRPAMPQQLNAGIPNSMMAQIKPVTPEEIANARRVNAHFLNMPDARIAAIMQDQRVKAFQSRLNNEQVMRQDPSSMPVQIGQPQINQPGTQMARQASASGAMSVPPQPGLQRPQSARPQGQGQIQPGAQAPKNLKRPNEGEGGQAPQSLQYGNRPQQQQVAGGLPNMTREQFEKLAPEQQRRYTMFKQMEQRQKEAQQMIHQMMVEVQGSMQPRKVIPNMNAANKARATKLLTQDQTKNMLGRFEQFIVQFFLISKDRESTKQLLQLRMQLRPQYKNNNSNNNYEVADQFSMTADQIEKALAEMSQKFAMTLQKNNQMRNQPQGLPVQNPPNPQQLTPGNLERLEQEQQEAQRRNSKTSKGKDVPPAPTTSQPPFTFGDPRGQGTPKYASAGLKQEDLKLDPKRRKRNPPTGATSATPGASTAGVKVSPEIKTEQQGRKAEAELPFKCAIVNCEYRTKGFATQPELNMHSATAHRPTEEPVEDPLAFFIDNMHKGLGLDENGHPGPTKVATAQPAQPRSLPMQKVASTASVGIKAEVMSKPGTPLPLVPSAQPGTVAADSWSNAKVQPELLHDVFSGPDPFATEFDLNECVAVYKQSDHWKNLPRADPKDGFCADWKAPEEPQQVQEKDRDDRQANLAGGNVQSPADGAEDDLLVDLKIDGLDIESDPDWEAIEDMDLNMDFEMDMDSPWENVPSAEMLASPAERIMSSDELTNPWDQLLPGGAGWNGAKADDARSHASYESLDWDAMFADEDNIVPGTNGCLAKRIIVKPKAMRA